MTESSLVWSMVRRADKRRGVLRCLERSRHGLLLVAAAVATGCSAPTTDPCARANEVLRHAADQDDPAECRKIVEFAEGPVAREWPSFWEWYWEAGLQPITMQIEIFHALAEGAGPTPHAFGPWPAEVPCGRGVPVEPGEWRDSELGRLGIRERATLFASWEVRLVGDPTSDDEQRVLILANQDADCDGVVATSEREGYFKRGTQVVLGGWKDIRVATAPLYE